MAFLARVRHPTWSPERWYEAYREARRTMDTVQTDPFDERRFNRAYDMRVRATWALASFGARGLPFALQMTKSKNADDRANATGILEAAAEDPAAVDALVQLAFDAQLETRDAAIVFLGRTKSEAAVPVLEQVVADENADPDTRDLARRALEGIRGRSP